MGYSSGSRKAIRRWYNPTSRYVKILQDMQLNSKKENNFVWWRDSSWYSVKPPVKSKVFLPNKMVFS